MEDHFYLWEYLAETKKPILIYGMGDGCDKILKVCEEKGIAVTGIFASDEYVRGKTVHGFDVIAYSKAMELYPDAVILLAFGVFRPELMETIVKIASERDFFAPEVPLFGGGLFDRDWEEAHKDEIEGARNLLADDTSREIFDHLLAYKRTGRIHHLLFATTEKKEDLCSLVKPKAGDTYLDLGAYDGDTILEWHDLFPHHGPLIGVEPNPKTFLKMMKQCEGIPLFRGVEAAAWNKAEALQFNGKSGRSAALDKDGKIEVSALPPDAIAPTAQIIKYDVEGAEKEALEGSRALITKEAPKLCISAYHRTEDLFAIPLQVHAMQPRYKVYLRHSPYIPAWDTIYYMIP